MQHTKVKSATVAGLLGIFLGQFGAHSWYLGKKKQGIAHVCLFAVAMIILIIGMVMAVSATTSPYSYYRAATSGTANAAVILCLLGWFIMFGNAIWALVEAIILFVQGDAGLAAKGYAVATPYNPAAQSVAGTQAQPTAPTQVAPQPKQPMNPATKKKIILGVAIGVAALVAIIIICVVIAIVSHVDYGEAYRQAKDLKDDVAELYTAYDCERVVSNVNSDWTSESNYNKYIEACKDDTAGIDDKIAELEKTAGVRKDSAVKTAFDKFKKEYAAVVPNSEELNSKLELYKTWHSYVVAVDDLSASDTDAEIQSAANILINSGNDTFKTYGEGWLEKTMEYVRAYRAYQNSSYSDSNRTQLRDDMYSKQTAQRTWVSENKPDITELAPLNFSDTAKMYNAYRDFYELLTATYEEHYNSGSGDCSELRDVVYCS